MKKPYPLFFVLVLTFVCFVSCAISNGDVTSTTLASSTTSTSSTTTTISHILVNSWAYAETPADEQFALESDGTITYGASGSSDTWFEESGNLIRIFANPTRNIYVTNEYLVTTNQFNELSLTLIDLLGGNMYFVATMSSIPSLTGSVDESLAGKWGSTEKFVYDWEYNLSSNGSATLKYYGETYQGSWTVDSGAFAFLSSTDNFYFRRAYEKTGDYLVFNSPGAVVTNAVKSNVPTSLDTALAGTWTNANGFIAFNSIQQMTSSNTNVLKAENGYGILTVVETSSTITTTSDIYIEYVITPGDPEILEYRYYTWYPGMVATSTFAKQ